MYKLNIFIKKVEVPSITFILTEKNIKYYHEYGNFLLFEDIGAGFLH